MKFSDPNMLYLIWVILLFFCVTFYGNRKRKRIIRSFAAAKERGSIIPGFSAARRWIKGFLLIISLFLIALSLAGPLVGFTWEKVEQKGVDIMICLDCSRSMLASDIEPSRLERAKREILDLLKMMKSDRAGLVAFAGDALLQCPLTLDHQAFNIFLKALNPDFLPVGGTDISGAIETALNSFEEKVDSEKAIILITDGENTSGEPLKIAKKAVDQGVKIFCIGVGNIEGAPVPDKEGGFTKDDSGRIILSKVDDRGLKEIAAMADGIYVRSVAGDMDLDQIYTENIQQHMEKKTLKSGRKKVWENRFQWFLFPAVLLLLIELCVAKEKKINHLSDTSVGISPEPDEKKYALEKNNHLSGMKNNHLSGIIAAFILVTLCSSSICHATASSSVKKGIKSYIDNDFEKAEKYFIDAQLQRPEMPELYYNIGTAAYKKGDYEAALKNFIKAGETEDKELKQKVIYNLGNTKVRLGKLEEAVKDYEKVLLQTIGDLKAKAKENLEFVKKKIEEEKQQQKNKDNQDKDNQDKDNQNKDNQDKDNQDKDNQNKDNQNKDNQNKNNQDQKNKSSDGDSKKEKNDPRKKKGDDKDSNKGNKPPGKKEEQKGEQGTNSGQDDQNLQKSSQEQNRAGERVLNRLEDKPGKAMIPAYGNQNVKKDW